MLNFFSDSARKTFWKNYSRLFSVGEIENSTALKWVFGAALFSHFTAFSSWSRRTIDMCWPYFQNCDVFHVLSPLPDYSQTTFFMGLFALILFCIFFMSRQNWRAAHAVFFALFVVKFLLVFVVSMNFVGNYEYYHLAFCAALLFLSHKLFFLKLFLVGFYFLSTAIKIHPGWVVGTYFSAMENGIPFVPNSLLPLWTNQLILMEMVGCWFLFSRNKTIRNIVLFYFAFFHLYSGVLVEYRYPSTVLPTLLILFGLFYEHSQIPKFRTSPAGWILAGVFALGQGTSHFIPGDEKITLEGNYYGLYMFEANHQCVSQMRIFWENGETRDLYRSGISARNRCNPYNFFFRTQNDFCESEEKVERIKWTFDHSINGGPFRRIVDTENLCALGYRPFSKNHWIGGHDSPVVGQPFRNFYR